MRTVALARAAALCHALPCRAHALLRGAQVLLVDDILATGGTMCAGIELVKAPAPHSSAAAPLSHGAA
jgi:adenine/guanine phosphoribosyltransferase-like PRPP-binding protein